MLRERTFHRGGVTVVVRQGWGARADAATLARLRWFFSGGDVEPLRTFLAPRVGDARLARLDDARVVDLLLALVQSGELVAEVVARLGGIVRDGDAGADVEEAPAEGKKLTPKTWIEIELLDMADGPVGGARYVIEPPDGRRVEGRLDGKGRARVDGLDPGSCFVSFPDLDEEAWARA